MKAFDPSAPAVAPVKPVLVDAPVSVAVVASTLAAAATAIPIDQALGALGTPNTLGELGQRLVTTVSMLWSDISGADLTIRSRSDR